jgi:hypothetical protein
MIVLIPHGRLNLPCDSRREREERSGLGEMGKKHSGQKAGEEGLRRESETGIVGGLSGV